MTAQLRIVVSDSGDVLKIPNQALRFRPVQAGLESQSPVAPSKGSATVWVVNADGRPDPVGVKLGASDDGGAALLEGPLTEGQHVIIGIASSQSRRSYLGVRLGF
jgi:HlyD family secretion protein